MADAPATWRRWLVEMATATGEQLTTLVKARTYSEATHTADVAHGRYTGGAWFAVTATPA